MLLLMMICLAGSPPSALAQWNPLGDRLQPRVAVQATAATDDGLPFWLVSNQYGRFSRDATNAVTQLGVTIAPDPSRTFDVSAGLDVAARASANAALYAHEWYGRLHVGPFRATLGRMEHIQGIVDTSLTMGSTTWSPNATPIPAIRVGAPSYVDVPFTRGFLAVKGAFAHGWLEQDRFVESPYLHEKQLYARVLPRRWPVQLHGGVIHNVVWAGTHPSLGELADGFDTFRKVVFVEELEGDEGLPGEGEDSGLGNTVAAYDFAVSAQGWGWSGRVYREFYIDTAAGRRFRNVWDGLWGVNVVRDAPGGWIDRVLFEHLRFVRQNAVKGAEGRRGARGREIYYNNFLYRTGWTYAGRVRGTPVALTDADAPQLANAEDNLPVTNNIIVANHLGIAGHPVPRWRYRVLATYSRNHGMFFNPKPRLDQFAALVEVHGDVLPEYHLGATAALATDLGAVFDDRIGLRLGLVWTPTHASGRAQRNRKINER